MYAGTLYSFNQQISPALTEIGLRALAVALVGGMDSLRGIVPAAILVAALEILAHQYFGSKTSEVIPFVLLAAILMARPWGLFGTKEIIDRV
jgi:branched-chain amino acid transport system permease protein